MKDIIKQVATTHDMTEKLAREVLKSFLDAIADDLAKGNDVRLSDFGTFEVRERKARTGRNPRTGTSINIPASRFPAFKAAKKLKDKVSGEAQAPEAQAPAQSSPPQAQPQPQPPAQAEPQPQPTPSL